MRFLFFSKNAAGPSPNPASANHLAACNILFLLVFSRNAKVGNPTHALCIGKAARNGG
jgi:hypothetical protein